MLKKADLPKFGMWKLLAYLISGAGIIVLASLLIGLLVLLGYFPYYLLGAGRDVVPYNDAYTLHDQLWTYVYNNGYFPNDEEAFEKTVSNSFPNIRCGYPKRKRWHYRLISKSENEVAYLLVTDSSRDLFKVFTYYGAEVVILGRAKKADGKWTEQAELLCRGKTTNRKFTYQQKP